MDTEIFSLMRNDIMWRKSYCVRRVWSENRRYEYVKSRVVKKKILLVALNENSNTQTE